MSLVKRMPRVPIHLLKNKIIQVRVSEAEYQLISNLAEKTNSSVSEYVRAKALTLK